VTLTSDAQGKLGRIPIEVKWSITDTPNLLRWFRVDEYVQTADNTALGVDNVTEISDFTTAAATSSNPPFPALSPTGRAPMLRKTVFSRPVLQFCGVNAGCSGISLNSALRVGSNYNHYAARDLTFFYVVARNSTATQHFLVNQSNGNNTGIYLGYINDTTLRFSLTGPTGATRVSATVAGYSGTPALEILTARLDTSAGSTLPGLRLYRNASVVASDPAILSQQAAATTIPYIGTQRTDFDNGNFYLAETAHFTRALSEAEMCKIHRYFDQKYPLGLSITCP